MALLRSITANIFKNVISTKSNLNQSTKKCTLYINSISKSFINSHKINNLLYTQKNFIFTSQCLHERNYDDVNHHVLNYLKQLSPGPQVTTTGISSESTRPSINLEDTLKRYIISIGHNEDVTDCNMIVDLFNLYAVHNRPIIQDKTDLPQEFNKMIWNANQFTKYMKYEEIQSLAKSLMTLRSQKFKFIDNLILNVCSECSSRLQHISLREGIDYFEIILDIFASGMGKRANYEIFIEFFEKNLDEASEVDLIKLMHYSSFNQNFSQRLLVEKSLERMKDSFHSMSFEILGIISNSILRGNVVLTSDLFILPFICNSLLQQLENNEELNVFQRVNFQNMVKLLRLSKYNCHIFVNIFQTRLMNCESKILDGEILPEIFAFFAQTSYRKDLFNKLENVFVNILRKDSSMSLTEYARVMWAFSHCNHDPSEILITLIHQDLKYFLKSGRAFRNYATFTDTLYSLAILGHSDPKILHATFTAKSELKTIGAAKKKMFRRLTCLHEHILIEFPQLSFTLPANTAKKYSNDDENSLLIDTNEQPAFMKLQVYFNDLNTGSGNKLFSVMNPMKTVNIPSICCTEISNFSNSDLLEQLSKILPVSIEVLDETNIVKQLDDGCNIKANGLFNYKVRLLKKSDWSVIVLNGKDVENSNDLTTLLMNAIGELQNTEEIASF